MKPTLKDKCKCLAKMIHKKNGVDGIESSIARCHEIAAKKLGYNSYNHLLRSEKC